MVLVPVVMKCISISGVRWIWVASEEDLLLFRPWDKVLLMRTSNRAIRRTIAASEIKRRGLTAVDKALKHGPVHVLKENEPAYVIMAEEQYRELSERYQRSYVSRVRRSLKDLKEGRVRRVTAQTLIDELGLEA